MTLNGELPENGTQPPNGKINNAETAASPSSQVEASECLQDETSWPRAAGGNAMLQMRIFGKRDLLRGQRRRIRELVKGNRDPEKNEAKSKESSIYRKICGGQVEKLRREAGRCCQASQEWTDSLNGMGGQAGARQFRDGFPIIGSIQ